MQGFSFNIPMFIAIFTTISLLSPQAQSDCAGCDEAAGATCDVTFVEDAVYGCGGIWTNAGVSNGDYLCGEGYSICDDYPYAETLGLTYELCMSSLSPDNSYYVTLLSSDGTLDCLQDGSNDLFGCANANTAPGWLYIDSNVIDCGPFGAQLSTDSFGNDGGAWVYGWEVWDEGQTGTIELDVTTHVDRDDTAGGVMCCKDEEFDDMSMFNDTMMDDGGESSGEEGGSGSGSEGEGGDSGDSGDSSSSPTSDDSSAMSVRTVRSANGVFCGSARVFGVLLFALFVVAIGV